ncbi:MAG: YraN family protein [Lachnospiraceae bacterium]
MNKRRIGSKTEEKVQEYLQKNGYDIVCRNFFSRYGELDIVAKKDGYLVFVEVKYRSGDRYGAPEEAVGFRKQKRIIETARYYLYRNGLPFDTPCRFDVAGVLGEEIRITENAFWL